MIFFRTGMIFTVKAKNCSTVEEYKIYNLVDDDCLKASNPNTILGLIN